MPQEPEFLTVKEVAERLRVSPEVVQARIRGGTLKAARIGKEYRIRHEDFDAYLKAVS